MVTCGLCGTTFREDRSQPACRACPLGADCGLVRCPACGYENPREPAWLGKLKGWFEGARDAPSSRTDEAGAGVAPEEGARE